MAQFAYNKFRAKKTVIDGITFSSKKEADRYRELKILLLAGYIKDLELQPRFELQPSFKKNGKTIRKIEYVADFRYYDLKNDKIVIEDTKGFKTTEYKLKKKLFEYRYKDLEIKEL